MKHRARLSQVRFAFFALWFAAAGAVSGCRGPRRPDEILPLWQAAVESPGTNLSAKAEDFPDSPDLRALLLRVLKSNPTIEEARAGWRKEQTKYDQVVSLPDPVLSYFLENIDSKMGPEKHILNLSQTIPFPRKLHLAGEVAQDGEELARLSYERAIRDELAAAQAAFYELLYLQKALEITRQNEQILHRFLQAAASEHSKGNAPTADLLRAQSQTAQMGYDLIRIEELRQVQIGRLNAILDRAPDAALELLDVDFPEASPLPPFEVFHRHGLRNQQEILAMGVEGNRANHELSLALAEYFPDITVGFSWETTASSDEGGDAWMFNLSLNLPVWISRRQARAEEAETEGVRVQAMRRSLENRLAASMKDVYYRAVNAHRLVELYEKSMLPQAAQSMATAENWYRDGKGTLLGVLEVQGAYLNFSLALARARADCAQSMVELARLSGGSLPDFAKDEKQGE